MTLAVPVTPLAVALTVAFPGLIPVTVAEGAPELFTAKTVESEEPQEKFAVVMGLPALSSALA